MNIPELLAYLRSRSTEQSIAEMLQKVEQFQLAKVYVDERIPNVHVVKSVERTATGKRTLVGIYAVELSLDTRGLIATKKASAPRQFGKTFAYTEPNHPYCVFGVDAYLSAAAAVKALSLAGELA